MFSVKMSFDRWNGGIVRSKDSEYMTIRGKKMMCHNGVPYETIKNGAREELDKYSNCCFIASYNAYIVQSRGEATSLKDNYIDPLFDTGDSAAIVGRAFFRLGKRIASAPCSCIVATHDEEEKEEQVNIYHEFQLFDTILMSLFFSCDALLDKQAHVVSVEHFDDAIGCFFKSFSSLDDFNYDWKSNLIIYDDGRVNLDKLMLNGKSFILIRDYPTLDGDYYQKQMKNGKFIVYNRVKISDSIGPDYEYRSSLVDSVSKDEVYDVCSDESYNYIMAFSINGFDLSVNINDEKYNKLTVVDKKATIAFYEEGYDPSITTVLDLRDGRKRRVFYNGAIIPHVNYYYEGSNLLLHKYDKIKGVRSCDGSRYIHATRSFTLYRSGGGTREYIKIIVISDKLSYSKFLTYYKKHKIKKLNKYIIN